MRTAVADTSIQAYRDLRAVGQLSRQQRVIMAAIKIGNDYSLQELVRLTQLPVNVVSGRVNELKSAQRLVLGMLRKCSVTGRTIHPVRLPLGQLELFSGRAVS